MKWLTFTSGAAANESAFNDAHARIAAVKGIPSGQTVRWSLPIAHPTQSYVAIPVDTEAEAALTDAEKGSLLDYAAYQAAGWVAGIVPKAPWWGALVFWR